MGRGAMQWIVPLAIGLLIAAGGVAAMLLGGSTLARIQVEASDLLFLRAGGPRLGIRAAPRDILLVQFDRRSAGLMKGIPSYQQDEQVYRALLAAGATLVADTRMIAEAGPPQSSPVKPLLDAMLAMPGKDRLLRDVWLGKWPAESIERYRPLVAHNLLNMHPNIDSFFDSRIYPLAVMTTDGLHESMPLVLARRAHAAASRTSAEILADLKSSGVVALWEKSMPQQTLLPMAIREGAASEKADYPFTGRRLPWLPIRATTPLVPPAGFWINYRFPCEELPRISYVDAHLPEVAAKAAGKIVLVGYDAATDPTADTYSVPTSTDRDAAVETVAAALETLLSRSFMRVEPGWLAATVVALLSIAAASVCGLASPIRAATVVAALLGVYAAAATLAYRSGWLVDVVLAPATVLAGGVLGGGYHYLREVRVKARIVDLFGRYVPKAVVTQLIAQRRAEALALGGESRDVTVLFADVRGFTSYAQRMPPEQVLRELNSLLKIMVDCTFAHEGTVDKFIGDAILVLFNAPLDQPDHVLRAGRTALAVQAGLKDHPSGLTVGIGIHRGEAVVGRVGTPERMEYTAVGSTVNIASRLCSAAKSHEIVVSETVSLELASEFVLEPQPPIRVKGIEDPLATSLLLRRKDEADTSLIT